MMRLDSHHHFWRYHPVDYAWMDDRMAVLKRDYLPTDLKPLLTETKFDGTVAVQARQNLEETRWLLELADHYDFIKGVVGWVDLCSPDLHTQLKTFCKHPKLAGVRHVIHDEPDDDFMLRPDFRRGIAQLCEFNLAYDLLLLPKHLPIAVKLVEEFPEQPFVLDHLGKPDIRARQISPWQENVTVLAQFPNVLCKLSGMVTETVWNGWRSGEFNQYLDVALAAFGPERVMIGSDWPVCNLSGDYATTMKIVTDYVQKFTPPVREKILGANCARFYGITSGPEKAVQKNA